MESEKSLFHKEKITEWLADERRSTTANFEVRRPISMVVNVCERETEEGREWVCVCVCVDKSMTEALILNFILILYVCMPTSSSTSIRPHAMAVRASFEFVRVSIYEWDEMMSRTVEAPKWILVGSGHIHYSFLCYDRIDEEEREIEAKTKWEWTIVRSGGGVDSNGNGTYTQIRRSHCKRINKSIGNFQSFGIHQKENSFNFSKCNNEITRRNIITNMKENNNRINNPNHTVDAMQFTILQFMCTLKADSSF